MARERTSRDFVPWRFSDAGYRSAWLDRRCRRPKTCTIAVVSRCSKDAPQKTRRNLLNHLVGGGEQCRRNREAECLRRVQIYDEIELCRLLDRNVGRLRPAQNLIDVISGAPKKIRVVWSKGNQTSRFYVISRSMNRRQSRADRQYVDSNSVGACERVGTDIKRLAAALELLEGGRDILRMPDFECDDFKTERAGCRSSLAQLLHDEGIADIAHDRQTAETGDDLTQKLEPLAGKISRQGC